MNPILFLFVFVFGTIIGSFLNVVIIRHGTGRSLGGRSKCAVTGKTLEWYELMPIISFLIQGGKSRHGGAKISWQYPLVEFFTGLSFVAIVYKFLGLVYYYPQIGMINIFFYFIIISLMIIIFVYDFHHQIIPDQFIYPLMVFGGIAVFLSNNPVGHFLAGPLLALPILILWFLTHGKGMGFGDVKLLIPIGWILGLSKGFASLLIAFWIGALVGIVLITFGNKKWKSKISFGPFLIIGFFVALLFGVDMSTISHFFNVI
jgi:prepilin signal peptidase PulO-like enzyme (type II secretory pathway)